MMSGQARSSVTIMGLDTHMISGGRALIGGPRCPQEAGQSRAVGAGTLDREPGHRPEASQPRRRRRRFSTRG
jgi:hypothetical protein